MVLFQFSNYVSYIVTVYSLQTPQLCTRTTGQLGYHRHGSGTRRLFQPPNHQRYTSPWFCGSRNRTRDLLITSPPHCQLSPGQTYVATTLRPLRDWHLHQSQRSQQGPRLVPARLQRSRATGRGPRCDQISRSQVFVLAQKPGCDWFGRNEVPAKSPTSHRSVAD